MTELTRRQILLGSAAMVLAGTMPVAAQDELQILRISRHQVDLAGGRKIPAYGIKRSSDVAFVRGGPFRARVENALDVPVLLHWHGLAVPYGMDGSFPGEEPIEPGGGRVYDFTIPRGGTHMMRASVDLLQQHLLAAPLIVRDIDELALGEQEAVLFLQDYIERAPGDVLKEIQTGEAPSGGMLGSIGIGGKPRRAVAQNTGIVRMDGWLANERTLADPDVIGVDYLYPVRLRVLNACAASNMLIDLGGLEGVLLALDGHVISPLSVRELALAAGQRADFRLNLPGPGAYPILARAEGFAARTGIVLATSGALIEKIAADGPETPLLTEFGLEARPFGADAPADRPADVKATFDLGGGQPGLGYNINGVTRADSELLRIRKGQRVEILIRNQTRQSQVLHMHGNSFHLRGAQGVRFAGPMRDTISVPPDSRVLIAFDANNVGKWPFNSTHIYRRAAGLQGFIHCAA